MRKLLFLSLALPCLAVLADTIDKVLLVVKNNGDKVAVLVDDVDSIVVEDADIVDDRYFLLDKDTVFITDTLIERDTIIERDTVTERDTIIQVDTLIQIDTLIERDTINLIDTVIERDTINDTIAVHDTTYVYETIHRTINRADKWYYNLENPSVSNFLNDFDYNDNDYTYSNIDNYLYETPFDKERPLGISISWKMPANELRIAENTQMENAQVFKLHDEAKSFCAYNLIPGRKYYWQAVDDGEIVDKGHFWTVGRMRMINLEGVHNVRDIGGMPTFDGRRTAYGRFFRGAALEALTDNDRSILKDSLGVSAEIDVRTVKENITTSPTLGEDVSYTSFVGRYVNYIWISNSYATYRKNFYDMLYQVLTDLRAGKTIYLHCAGGADRTGSIALLLEGLAGCYETDIAKDYEITSFSVFGTRKRVDGVLYDGITFEYAKSINYLKRLGGTTFQQNVAAYFRKIGFTDAEIEELRELLLE